VRKLAGCGEDRLRFFNVDICDAKALRAALEAGPEFAGKPLLYLHTYIHTYIHTYLNFICIHV
jgi:hypothetical protein